MRRAVIQQRGPNAAHRAIFRLPSWIPTTVVTQNVDGLDTRAGTIDPVELHGSIARARYFAGCGWRGDTDALEAADVRVPPYCPGRS